MVSLRNKMLVQRNHVAVTSIRVRSHFTFFEGQENLTLSLKLGLL